MHKTGVAWLRDQAGTAWLRLLPRTGWRAKVEDEALPLVGSHVRRRTTEGAQQFTHGTKLDLRLWICAVFLVLTSSKGISSVVMARLLGVNQKTAWKMRHAIREMMDDRNGEMPPLEDVVEIYIGLGKTMADHYRVIHSKHEYADPETGAHINTAEAVISRTTRAGVCGG